MLAVRGRVGGIRPTALVDLGKPAFKLGVAEIRRRLARAFELNVGVDAATSAVYRVRETAAVTIAVSTADGKPPPPDAAKSRYRRGRRRAARAGAQPQLGPARRDDGTARRTACSTATAQGQVVGKRHYGLKARRRAAAADGSATRELFDTLLLWKGRVSRSTRTATRAVEVPLNDSLTSFRIVAVAIAAARTASAPGRRRSARRRT